MTGQISRSTRLDIKLDYTNMAPAKAILIINPNSTSSMTDGLKPLVEALNFHNTKHDYFTAPSGPKSINNEDDAAESLKHCTAALEPLVHQYDGFLVACYSQHPLVPWLKEQISKHAAASAGSGSSVKCATGIFEASVATSLQVIGAQQQFGIVSTGKVWEEILSEAVAGLLGTSASSSAAAAAAAGTDAHGKSTRFAGVETTGLNATELHDTPPEIVRRKMKEATKRLLRSGGGAGDKVGAVCLGCAGMAGMSEMVREAAVEELGQELGGLVKIVDGVQAGVAWLEGAIRMQF